MLKEAFGAETIYRARMGTSYSLLPFRFLRLDSSRYVLTNLVGEYVVVDRESLQAFVKHKLEPETDTYENLKAKHFLLDGDSTVAADLLACKYRTQLGTLPSLTSLFIFVVTLRCEHSCPYCQVSRQSEDRHAFDMQKAHAEKAIDFVFATPAKNVKVEFQGGEPLLNFDLIQWIVERVEDRNTVESKNVAFVIATNLALVTDEMLTFCRDHKILISTSLDGPRDLHNHNRPRKRNDSYERAIDGIERARAIVGRDRVSALMTTTKASLQQPQEIVDEYVARGFPSIFLRALSPYGFAVKTRAIASYSTAEWLVFYRSALDHIIYLNLIGVRFREDYASLLLRKMLTPFPTSYVDLQTPAGVGISCLVFNYTGEIYASDEARMLAEMNDKTFRLGHLDEDTFTDVITSDKLIACLETTLTESMPMCADCGVQPYCGSDPVFHHATQGDMVGLKPTSGFCQKNMEVIRHLIRLMEDDPEAARVLRTWIL